MMADDTVQIVGRRADGTEVVVGEALMPPLMKARELAREMFGGDPADDTSDTAMAFWVCENFYNWLVSTGQLKPGLFGVQVR
jgi:hypothetical protein